MRKIILLFIFFYANFSIYAQADLDSLKIIWNSDEYSDTIRLKAVNTIVWEHYMFSNPDSALYYSQLQYDFVNDNKLSNKIGDAINNRASALYFKGFFKEALNDFHNCLDFSIKKNDLELINGSYINLSAIYNLIGNFDEALYYNQKSYQLIDNEIDSKEIAYNYFNSGSIYTSKKKYNKALEYYFKSLSISESIDNTNLTCMILGHIGGVLIKKQKYLEALSYFEQKLELAKAVNNYKYIASTYSSLGEIYKLLGNYQLATKYLYLAINVNENFHISVDNEANYKYLYQVYKALNDEKNALEMFEIYTSIKDSINRNENFNESVRFEEKRKYNEIMYRDSIVNHQKTIYNTKKIKQKEKQSYFLILIIFLVAIFSVFLFNRVLIIRRQKKVIEKQREVTLEKNRELERLSIVVRETENIILILDSVGNLEWVNDSFVKLNNLTLEEVIAERGEHITTISNNSNVKQILETCRTTKKPYRYDSLNITNQGGRVWESSTITPIFDAQGVLENFIIIDTDITKQKNAEELVNQRNKDITDSIYYAKRLQNAMMSNINSLTNYQLENYILFIPKGILSGDFYWIERYDGKIYFAVADCTGHSVPGAMVSVICCSVLSKALLEEGITKPSLILNRARDLVVNRFVNSDEKIRDGMDISLCSLDINSGELEWAGANNPLWIIRKNSNEIEEIISDKQPIGMFVTNKPFTNHSLKVNKGDQFYLFSDGFSDQFGGETGKKYKSSKLKDFLLSIKDQKMDEQLIALTTEFDSWKGDLEQIDDVCVMGVRV